MPRLLGAGHNKCKQILKCTVINSFSTVSPWITKCQNYYDLCSMSGEVLQVNFVGFLLTRFYAQCSVSDECFIKMNLFATTLTRLHRDMPSLECNTITSQTNSSDSCHRRHERTKHKLRGRPELCKFHSTCQHLNARTPCCWLASPSSTRWAMKTTVRLLNRPTSHLLSRENDAVQLQWTIYPPTDSATR